MTYQDATAALAAMRYPGDIEQIRQVIEAYDRQPGSSNLWESSCLRLQACDVLSSHDFGDHEGQAELIRTYAQQALLRSGHASIEEELRLLAHLAHDYEDVNSRQPWPVKRLARARRWLRALKVLAQDTRDFDSESLPAMKTTAPGQDLPSGVAAHHVEDSKLRSEYRRAVNSNRQDAERFAFQWRMMQLRRIYEPLATKYIASAYAREPYNLGELKRLLADYPAQEERSSKEFSDGSAKDERSQTPEPKSAPEEPVSAGQLHSEMRNAKRNATGRKAATRRTKRRKT
jgi:hypothetical protein